MKTTLLLLFTLCFACFESVRGEDIDQFLLDLYKKPGSSTSPSPKNLALAQGSSTIIHSNRWAASALLNNNWDRLKQATKDQIGLRLRPDAAGENSGTIVYTAYITDNSYDTAHFRIHWDENGDGSANAPGAECDHERRQLHKRDQRAVEQADRHRHRYTDGE